MLRIRKPRGVTRGQLVLITILGVFGGVYIWKPLLVEYFAKTTVAEPVDISAKPIKSE